MGLEEDAIAPIKRNPTGDGTVYRNGHVGHFEGKKRRQAARKSYYSLYSWYRGLIEARGNSPSARIRIDASGQRETHPLDQPIKSQHPSRMRSLR